jgi:hypothetical protein
LVIWNQAGYNEIYINFQSKKIKNMEQLFDINLSLLNKKGHVKKSPFPLTIIREGMFTVSVDQLPLTEYFILIDHKDKKEQIKTKVYKTAAEGKWYDKNYSEEAESNSPEFGIPEIIAEIKQAIDMYEIQHATA